MKANPVLDEAQWRVLLEEIAETYREVTLSRGFQYFKQERVESLVHAGNGEIQARVVDEEPYLATLRLDDFRSSSCTCPMHKACKHLAAAVMALADRYGFPASRIVNAKHAVKQAANASLSEQIGQLEGLDVIGWHRTLERLAARVAPSQLPGDYAHRLRQQVEAIQRSDTALHPADWNWFELHRELFLLHKEKESLARAGGRPLASLPLYRQHEAVEAGLRERTSGLDIPHSGHRLTETLQYMRQQMARNAAGDYLDYGLYTAMWQAWVAPFRDAAVRAEEELAGIEEQRTESVSPSLAAAEAFLLLTLSRADEAWEAAAAIGPSRQTPPGILLTFFRQLADAGCWQELADWLRQGASSFYGRRDEELQAYADCWQLAAEHVPGAEKQMWEALAGMLPHSLWLLEKLLYEKRSWAKWIELQILQERDPLHHRVSVLQPIEKEAPEALLPYYHQAVARCLGLKNRHAYKQTVRLLKRLRNAYKRSGREASWDRFLADFAQRNSRLRALQEEMRKGKLLE
ncbi:hypothetical protein J31TS4_00520 [Paenibacillus sp. J31TS4]|uniref:SWIM zinc finger family protein n=1 Tax=Paenibacillus sp. J31TS4 TaxID=2807195 RepID=UPI001B0ED6E2|nr:SWIM zinc finger family protein [Paenibacillus sp. J31TS4]GIP36772.1 hypothetical protein J31TS4_00520 [Paenibacillus sp. J31TS4]